MARSLLIYYGVPLRSRRLARFYARFIQPGSLCFDLGAHIGNRLKAMLSVGAEVIALEPNPTFTRLLRRWYPDAKVLEQAVGARPGDEVLHVSRRTPTVATLSKGWAATVQQAPAFSRVQWDADLRVTVTTLDALIARYGEPSFCKIDVEGYELHALQGLSRPLPFLSLEYVPAAIEAALASIRRLERLGRYSYNWTIGESTRFQAGAWCSGSQLIERLARTHRDGRPGDIYARLVV